MNPMDNAFLPLLPAAALASGPSGVRVLNSAEASAPFQALNVATPPSPPHPDCLAHGQPTVTIQRDGQRVAQIRIQCPCGQVIELECQY
jgi:hypothetical protein